MSLYKNSEVILLEIKSSCNKSDIYFFKKKSLFYEKYTHNKPNKMVLITPFTEKQVVETACKLGISICDSVEEIPVTLFFLTSEKSCDSIFIQFWSYLTKSTHSLLHILPNHY